MRAGFVAKIAPVGAPRGARAAYALADVYLAFWFRVLYSDLGQVFEDLARAHAQRFVARGDLPHDLVIGRWWATPGAPCEVDVLGLRGRRTALVGEAR